MLKFIDKLKIFRKNIKLPKFCMNFAYIYKQIIIKVQFRLHGSLKSEKNLFEVENIMASLMCVHIFTGNLHSEWTKIWPGEKNGILGSRFFL
jgi:hypothetical protein